MNPVFSTQGASVYLRPDTILVDLEYPGRDRRPALAIEVGLIDVRAADNLRIQYDFERDGWSIRQASRFSWLITDAVCDPDWQEVAFVKAWAREVKDAQD